MVDLFDEVDEELRSDRAVKLLRSVLPIIIGVLAIVLLGYLGYWGYTAWQDRNLAAGAAAYQKGVDSLSDGDQKAALADFEAAKNAGAPGYKTLALMQEGNLKLEANDTPGAVRLYDQAAASAPNLILGDLARLKAAQALLDTAPLPQLRTRLQPLTDAQRPYSIYAREALAMAKLMAGQTAEAKKDFQVIELNLSAPQDMRERSQIALALIDSGEAPTAVAAAKLAATMPPPPPMMVAPPAPAPQGPPTAPSLPAGAAR